MSAIKSIGNALNYDAAEIAIMAPGGLATAMAIAAMNLPAIGAEEPKAQAHTTNVWGDLEALRETVRPSKWSL